ncbi:MAG: DEAD/DEAH box helicase [Chitinophagaceae bacterium]|nr:DEAD/DEAH box helicase [Chitinophagaceae bacterium]
MSFINTTLHPSVSKAITEQGYSKATPIQQQAIPATLERRDVLGCAQTGTGKTAAFLIPILQMLLEDNYPQRRPCIKALILAPTRELALQIAENTQSLSAHTTIKHVVLFGGVSQQPQIDKLRAGVDILIATPGRLKDLMNQGHVALNQVKYLVLDEADRMLDMGFIHDIKQIIRHIPADRQTLFFSATMPTEILKLTHALLRNPVRIEVTPVATAAEQVTQYVYFSEKQQKPSLLLNLLGNQASETVIVFTKMKHVADKLSRFLNKEGISAAAIHGNKSQLQRQTALERFKHRQTRVLVATDIAARGIDVDKLSHVINYDLPQTAETYVHRIGRTGRAGAAGTAISICSREEKPMLIEIQKLIKKTITVASIPGYSQKN